MFTLCTAHFKRKYKSTELICEIAQFIFHRSQMHMYFILSRSVGILHPNSSTVFISLLGRMRILATLSTFGLLMGKEGWKGKGAVGCPIFPFASISSFSV